MSKKIFKICAMILALGVFAFSGCTPPSSGGQGGSSGNNSNVITTDKRETFNNGVHQYNYTDTNHILVENGKTSYKIVIERNAPEEILLATEELQDLFLEATGANLSIAYSDSVAYSENAEFIVLGQNELFEQAQLSTNGLGLGLNGYIIKTRGKSIFIAGDDVYGTMFGMYQFLTMEYDFDCFAIDCYTIAQKQKTTLKNFDVLDIPDIETRSIGNNLLAESISAKRMRFMPRGDKLFAGTIGVHSTFECFPKTTYLSEHPEWYNKEQNELCYTAGGDPESLEEMKKIALKYVQDNFIENTRAHMITFSHQDTMSWCYCKGCAEVKSKYGANSATAILFINDLANRVEAWMETPEGQPYARDFKITFLAYTTTEAAPVLYDEKTDTFTPVDDAVKCGKHVQVMFAPINMDYQNSIYSEVNSSYYKNFRAWRVLCDEFNIYSYHANYDDFFSFFDTFEQLQEFYIFAANSNTNWLYDLGQNAQGGGATGWNTLKEYLISKFGWNVNYNFDELVDKFFKAYYGPAADVMMDIFTQQRVRVAYNLKYQGLTTARSCYAVLTEAKYWPKNLLEQWVAMYDEALKNISSLQFTAPETYELYSKNIRMERLSVYFSMIKIYENKYSKSYMLEMKKEFRDACELCGITYLGEGNENTVVSLWTEWGMI